MGYKLYRFAVKHRNLVVLIFAVSIFSFIGTYSHTALANDKKVVSIYYEGTKRTVTTDESTVKDVLTQEGIFTSDQDLIEPELETEIISEVFSINIYKARPVTIIDGFDRIQIMSAYQSPKLIAEQAGIEVFPEDIFTLERIDNFVLEGTLGQRLTITRATPVLVDLYGSRITYRSHVGTVGELLEEHGIELGENDTLSPSAETQLTEDLKIHIVSTGEEVVTVEEKIPFETELIYDSNKLAGENEVKSEGETGLRLVTYKIKLQNGEEVGRTETQSVVSKEPVTEVKVVGTKAADSSSNVALGQSLAKQRGWTGAQWQCLHDLWMKESKWDHTAANGYSGAFGIPQALPGSKMSSAGADWASNPSTQIIWGMDYIAGRYGTPCAANSFHVSNNWY